MKNEMKSALAMDEKSQENSNHSSGQEHGFIRRHFLVLLLLVALVFSGGWYYFRVRFIENKYENEKTELVDRYEQKLDSAKIVNLKFSSKVFSWSVRSEMIRKNEENLNQLVSFFVKESGAQLVQIVNLESNQIIVSSDKKKEGELFVGPKGEDLHNQIVLSNGKETTVLSPIIGLNTQIGVLIVTL